MKTRWWLWVARAEYGAGFGPLDINNAHELREALFSSVHTHPSVCHLLHLTHSPSIEMGGFFFPSSFTLVYVTRSHKDQLRQYVPTEVPDAAIGCAHPPALLSSGITLGRWPARSLMVRNTAQPGLPPQRSKYGSLGSPKTSLRDPPSDGQYSPPGTVYRVDSKEGGTPTWPVNCVCRSLFLWLFPRPGLARTSYETGKDGRAAITPLADVEQ